MSLRFLPVLLLLGAARLLPAQCLNVPNCPAATDTTLICSLSPNNANLWNDSHFWNPVTASSNLFEAESEIIATASYTPNCSGPISVEFELYLDLDGNGTPETVVLSSSLPESGKIRFGNIADPVNGGTLVSFDNRPVTAAQKYHFAAEIHQNSNNTVTARLIFTTDGAPTNSTTPIMPNGRHKLKWIFSDPSGSTASCTQHYNIVDCKKPTVVCLNGLSVNLMPGTPPSITLFASDFLQYTQDNVSESANIQIGVRKSGTGTGFPTDTLISYDCSELGTNAVELWAIDEYGNADFCETYIILQDNLSVCPGGATSEMSFCVKNWCDGATISGIDTAYISNNQAPVLHVIDPPNCSDIYSRPYTGYLAARIVKNDDMLNGVTVVDALKILRHILGIEPVQAPYGYYAADVNNSQSITIADPLAILRLLVGIPGGQLRDSWTIVDSASISLANPVNPYSLSGTWVAADPSVPNLNVPFTAIKTGDLDCDALPGLVGNSTEDREAAVLRLPDMTLQAGETAEIPLTFVNDGQWLALQMGLRFDPALLSITGYTSTLDDTNFGLINTSEPGAMNIAWMNTEAVAFPAGSEMARIQIKANAAVQLKNAISFNNDPKTTYPLGYDANFGEQVLVLDFTSGARDPLSDIGIKAPSPNPVRDAGATVSVSANRTQAVSISLFDINGRQCFVQNTTLTSGANVLQLPAEAFSAGSGTYVWRVTTATGSAGGKLVKF